MSAIRSVAVFCGARPGHDPACIQAAQALGRALAARGLRLVFGGGQVGMMGAVADAVLGAGGTVLGVIPEFLTRLEVAHGGVADMRITPDMHTRKRIMFDASDAFVIMPGGLGTLDELAEIVTWRQLGLHNKPILLVDINGWARPIAAVLEAFVTEGFAAADTRRLYEVVPDVDAAMARLCRLPASPPGDPART